MPHPMVTAYIQAYEREAQISGSYRKTLGKLERLFLENVWGPVMQYQFTGLKAEYPLKDLKGGQRFADFVYVRNGLRLMIELDGYTTHARDISPGEFDDHLSRQNDMVLTGWLLLRFSYHQVEKRPLSCQGQLKQAIGHWWTTTTGATHSKGGDMWYHRRLLLISLAVRNNGILKPADVAHAFEVSSKSACLWLKKFTEDGTFLTPQANKRTTKYTLAHYAPDE